MAGQADFKVILTIDSQGNAKIEEVKKSLEGVGTAADQANRQGAAGADEFASALMRKLGVLALVTAGFYALERVVVGGFRAGIQAQDDFQLNTIGVAATLTDLGKEGANAQLNYANNIAYSRDMYNELELAAAHHFASGKDLIQGWNILAQKGIVLRKEEIEDLGIIVDKIKLATQGQVQGIQIAQELRAMLSGQSRQTDQLAMIIKDRYGAAWEEIIKQHREAGDLLSWLAGEFKGLQYASQDVQGTLTSQKTTLETLLSQVGRQGLAGAYEDVVKWLSEGNNYLREHKNEIAYGIVVGWERTKELAGDVLKTVQIIGGIIAKPVTWTINIGGTLGKWLASDKGIQALAEGGYGGVYPAEIPQEIATRKITTPSDTRIAQAAAGGRQIMQTPYGQMEITNIPMDVETRKMAGDTGGGKSTEGALNSMQSLMDRLNQDIAKFSEGSLAAVDAWYDKTMNDIAKLVAKGAEGADAEALAWQAGGLKKGKIVDDFWLMVDKETGQGFEALDKKYLDDLTKYGSIQGAKEALLGIWQKKTYDLEQKQAKDIEDLRKSSLAVMAANAPLLSEQLALQGLILNVEIERKRLALEKKILDDHIPEAQAAELRGLQALAVQYERQAQQRKGWAAEGMSGGIKLFALDLRNESETAVAFGIRDGLKGAKGYADSGITDLIMSPFTKKKMDFKKIGLDIATSIAGGMVKLGTTKLFSTFTEGALGMVSTWQTAQEAMTAASTAGEAVRLASMSGGASQGLSMLMMLGKAGVMVKAGEAAASVYASVAAIPIIGWLLAPPAAALAFAAVAAFGNFGGVGGGTGGGPGEYSPGAYHTGGVVAHQGWLVAHAGRDLAADERHVIAQVGEGILQNAAMDKWARAGVGFDLLNDPVRLPNMLTPLPVPVGGQGGGGTPSGGGGVQIGAIHVQIDARGADKSIDWDHVARRKIIPAILKDKDLRAQLAGRK